MGGGRISRGVGAGEGNLQPFTQSSTLSVPVCSGGLNRRPQTAGLTQQKFLVVLEAEVQDEDPVRLISGEASPPGLQTAAVLLCPHVALPCVCAERQRELWYFSLCFKATVLWD